MCSQRVPQGATAEQNWPHKRAVVRQMGAPILLFSEFRCTLEGCAPGERSIAVVYVVLSFGRRIGLAIVGSIQILISFPSMQYRGA
jgi:hypothetical protein